MTAGSINNFSSADPRTPEYFLTELLPDKPLDHHGRAIADIIPRCVENHTGGIEKYLESRLLKTERLKELAQLPNKEIKVGNIVDNISGNNDMYTSQTNLWVNSADLIEDLYTEAHTNV
jgi:hypothetical protein